MMIYVTVIQAGFVVHAQDIFFQSDAEAHGGFWFQWRVSGVIDGRTLQQLQVPAPNTFRLAETQST